MSTAVAVVCGRACSTPMAARPDPAPISRNLPRSRREELIGHHTHRRVDAADDVHEEQPAKPHAASKRETATTHPRQWSQTPAPRPSSPSAKGTRETRASATSIAEVVGER
jgi:hypothetical protein